MTWDVARGTLRSCHWTSDSLLVEATQFTDCSGWPRFVGGVENSSGGAGGTPPTRLVTRLLLRDRLVNVDLTKALDALLVQSAIDRRLGKKPG